MVRQPLAPRPLFMCPKCGRKFFSKTDLRLHRMLRTH